jgi:hypothetical protein
VQPLDSLSPGRRRFCIGRWLGMLALGDEPLPIIDLDEPASPARRRQERQAERDLATARESIASVTKSAVGNDGPEPLPAFLARVVRTCETRTPHAASRDTPSS